MPKLSREQRVLNAKKEQARYSAYLRERRQYARARKAAVIEEHRMREADGVDLVNDDSPPDDSLASER